MEIKRPRRHPVPRRPRALSCAVLALKRRPCIEPASTASWRLRSPSALPSPVLATPPASAAPGPPPVPHLSPPSQPFQSSHGSHFTGGCRGPPGLHQEQREVAALADALVLRPSASLSHTLYFSLSLSLSPSTCRATAGRSVGAARPPAVGARRPSPRPAGQQRDQAPTGGVRRSPQIRGRA
ncbi:unnamed protein product [Urochloa humidicola]